MDKNGLWSNEVTEITIHRLPAWYETCALQPPIDIIYIYASSETENQNTKGGSAELVKNASIPGYKRQHSTSEFAEIDKLLLDRATKAVEEHLNEPEFQMWYHWQRL